MVCDWGSNRKQRVAGIQVRVTPNTIEYGAAILIQNISVAHARSKLSTACSAIRGSVSAVGKGQWLASLNCRYTGEHPSARRNSFNYIACLPGRQHPGVSHNKAIRTVKRCYTVAGITIIRIVAVSAATGKNGVRSVSACNRRHGFAPRVGSLQINTLAELPL